MVYCPTGPHPPEVRHPSAAAARTEAERLACANPRHRFFVLESIGVCEYNPLIWRGMGRDEEPPF